MEDSELYRSRASRRHSFRLDGGEDILRKEGKFFKPESIVFRDNNDYSSCSDDDGDGNEYMSTFGEPEKDRKRSKRGKYRKYPVELKKRAIELALDINDPIKAAKKMCVPPKNLKRWMSSGPYRKKGGRKT